jgi:hypothetical protein
MSSRMTQGLALELTVKIETGGRTRVVIAAESRDGILGGIQDGIQDAIRGLVFPSLSCAYHGAPGHRWSGSSSIC